MFFAAAKDTLIHETAAINGVLDDRFEWIPAEENPLGLGGRYTVTRWPAVPGWSFVAVGRGHDVDFWARFLDRAARGTPRSRAVNIEHEDASFGQIEGLEYAARNLIKAAERAGRRSRTLQNEEDANAVKTIEHWIAGKPTSGDRPTAPRRSSTRPPASSRPRSLLADVGGRRGRHRRRQRTRSPSGRRRRSASAPRSCSRSASWSTPTPRRSPS